MLLNIYHHSIYTIILAKFYVTLNVQRSGNYNGLAYRNACTMAVLNVM